MDLTQPDDRALRVAEALESRGEHLALAESCTGGGVSARLASIPGASSWLWGTVVVYTAQAKSTVLGLSVDLLERHGTVSEATTAEMADAVRRLSGVEWGAAVTCWAGPGGGTGEDPVGTTYLAVAGGERVECRRARFSGPRANVCLDAGSALLELLRESLDAGEEAEWRA